MSGTVDISESQARRLEEAAAWHIRLGEDAQPGADFAIWLADPLNRAAFDAVCAGWNVFADQDVSPELIRLRQEALASARRRARSRWESVGAWRQRIKHAAAAVVLVGLVLAAVWGAFFKDRQVYATAFGERRVLTLADGSSISLDSDTRLFVHYTENARALRLDRGQARFDVTHDVRRPFTVTAGNQTVVAVGTSFNVERLGAKVVITLIEGRVIVNDADGQTDAPQAKVTPISVLLSAGQMLVAGRGRAPTVMAANLLAATAWQNGMLVFNDDTLGDAIARVNRYTDRPIIADPSVTDLRVSGAFNAADLHAFIEALTMYFPIEATIDHNGQVILKRRPS